MKRFLTILLFASISLYTFAQQAQLTIESKKDKLSDFQIRTMKVVLLGEDYISMSLREAIKNSWHISPYEFCDNTEFERLKKDDKFYFMVIITKQTKQDEGISYLKIVKGGASEIDDMIEVVTLPICASHEAMGREGVYMPAMLGIMQNYIDKSLMNGFKKFETIIKKIPKGESVTMLLSEADLSSQVDDKLKSTKLSGMIKSEKTIGDAIQYGHSDTIAAYSIYPVEPKPGSLCYKFLFDTKTHDLYYFKKHKISESKDGGFLKGDIKRITAGR